MRIRLMIPALVAMLAWETLPASAALCGTVLDPMTVSGTTLAFGNYFPNLGAANTTTVSINCGLLGIDLLPAFTVSLVSGNSSNPTTRYMGTPSQKLNYNVYTTLNGSAVWGDGTAGSVTQSFDGLLSIGTISFTGYGRVPAGQYIPAGPYNDQITVKVTY